MTTDTESAAPTYKQVIAAWNSQADEHNQWEELGEDEKVEWATTYASAAPQQEPSYTAVQLAEMVLYDCGHSSNNTGLLDRVSRQIDAHVQRHLDELLCCLESKPTPKPSTSQVDAQDTARSLFDAGWKACAKFCDRDDVIYDGIVGSMGCPEFEKALDAVWAAQKDKL